MAFLDDVKSATLRPGAKCVVGEWLNSQDDVTPAELDEALGEATAAAVWRAMKSRGFEYTRNPVERHAKGECACHRF